MNASTGSGWQGDMARARGAAVGYPKWPGTKRVSVRTASEGVYVCRRRTWPGPIDPQQLVPRIIAEGSSPDSLGPPAERAAMTILTAAIGVSHWFVRGIPAPGAQSSEASHGS
jgi:hypothetical protein